MARSFGMRWGVSKKPRKGRWSTAEISYLKESYGKRQEEVIARELGRPIASVRKMVREIFRGPRRRGSWAQEEEQVLRECLGVSPVETIALILRRSESDVERHIASLRTDLHKGRWSPEEIVDLKRLYGSRQDEDLARILGRSVASIRRQARKLFLAKDKTFMRRLHRRPSTRMPRWSVEEVRSLVRLYRDRSNLEIAERLGRSVKSIVSKAHELELKKSSARLREMGRSNVSLRADRRG